MQSTLPDSSEGYHNPAKRWSISPASAFHGPVREWYAGGKGWETAGMKPEVFEKRLASYFERYKITAQILRSLFSQRSAAQDFILLACARLDSLANHACPSRLSGEAQAEKFTRLLLQHSGHKALLEQISLPDLYTSLLVELWQLPGVVDAPGRLRMFEPFRQRDFIEMHWKSGLALDEQDLEGLLSFLLDRIRSQYRVIPYQSRKKLHADTIVSVQQFLSETARQRRGGRYAAGIKAIKPILKAHQLAAILYREYRNGSIHGGGVDIDEVEFFTAKKPHWSIVDYQFVTAKPVFQVLFPANFLFEVYENCVAGYYRQLLATRKLPASIFNELFPGSVMRHLDYLDQNSVEDAVELKPKLDR